MGTYIGLSYIKDGRYAGEPNDPDLCPDKRPGQEIFFDLCDNHGEITYSLTEERFYRPKDFAHWRSVTKTANSNSNIFLGMVDAMEKDNSLYICFM
jgi:hypothetical protein